MTTEGAVQFGSAGEIMGTIDQEYDPGLLCGAQPRPYDLAKLAYASGYFDGEGTINVLKWRGVPRQIRVELTSYDLDALLVFEELFGGRQGGLNLQGSNFKFADGRRIAVRR